MYIKDKKTMAKLSVVLATYNEEINLGDCLKSVKDIADEIIIVDGSSTDQTVKIAKNFGAEILVKDNPPIFHINKQKALDMATNEWVLQLDADERVSPKLALEIKKIINMNKDQIDSYQNNLPTRKLFLRHQRLIEKRDGQRSEVMEYNAFYLPRLNYFLGRFMRYGGIYPDGVIRLVKKNYAKFPCKSVHEQIEINGLIGWLQNPLYHYDSPDFKRYYLRNSRYIDLMVNDFKREKTDKSIYNFIRYILLLPLNWFILTYIRHKGFMDSWQGFVFSFFSALRFPRAYIRYLKSSDSLVYNFKHE